MANPYLQKARLRKVVYAALIMVLFTGSLMHRRLVVEPAAENLQLREVSRGEVELTSSAVRLTLTGSRGLAVTLLWASALKEQEKHKWNEVELLVSSITKLQPYFITPWLFQSWNLAFNVSVECDKPRDKYYYVSRGLQLLAEGERRNQGAVDDSGRARFPGNPDMRHHMGFTYQLKIGNSDEKNAMQCLLDMSCIDPVKRDPDALWSPGEYGREVNLPKFEEFCSNHPRLVRRLSDTLKYDTPKQVVNFLKDNQVLPGRFSEKEKKLSGDSVLESPRKQFPILPPKLRESWPDPASQELTSESLSVFVISRTWFSFAQLPLPPAFADPGASEPVFDPIRQRVPKHMSIMIFRGYPCRAQGFIAETLEAEGWFDLDGWSIKDWFGPSREVTVGTEPKYQAGPAWEKTYQMYREHGTQNGLYLLPGQREELEQQAQLYRKKFTVRPGERLNLRADQRTGAMGRSYHAHQKLAWYDHYRHLTNFDDHLYEADAERNPQTILARKLFFNAKRLGKSGAAPQALANYEQALPLFLDMLLQYPQFRNITTGQEDTYEVELKYIRLWQNEKAALLRPLCMGMAQLSVWPYPPFDGYLSAAQKAKIIPIRNFRGPLDQVMVFNAPQETELKKVLLIWSQAGLPLPMLVYPGQQNRLLALSTFRREPPPRTLWAPLIATDSIRLVRDRVGLSVQK